MKKTQSGFIGIALIIIAAIIVGAGGTYMAINKDTKVDSSLNNYRELTATGQQNSNTAAQVRANTNASANTNVNLNTNPPAATAQVSTNVNSSVSMQNKVDTTGWKTYDSGRGFEFKYPNHLTLRGNSTAENIILYNGENGTGIVVNIKNSTQSLEQNVQETVSAEKAASANAATLVTVTSKAHTIGNLKGYLITNQASDVLLNTDAMFKIKEGNNIVTFKYSYQGFILLKDPASVTGGAPVDAEFKSDLQARLKAYGDIQTIISTFRFFTSTSTNSTINLVRYLGSSYGFSHPSDWDVRVTNSLLGSTELFPKSKADKYMNKTLSITERVSISLVENKYVDLANAQQITINGQTWYVISRSGSFDGGTESNVLEYIKVYNSSKYVVINSGLSNKAVIEAVVYSFITG